MPSEKVTEKGRSGTVGEQPDEVVCSPTPRSGRSRLNRAAGQLVTLAALLISQYRKADHPPAGNVARVITRPEPTRNPMATCLYGEYNLLSCVRSHLVFNHRLDHFRDDLGEVCPGPD